MSGRPTLPRPFFERPTLQVARDLLGAILVHRLPDGRRLAGRVCETEAYIGDDAASHARSGPTGRAAVMFGEPARAYVYLIYGMYHCFNIVTEGVGFPAAVLVRAVEPREAAAGRRANGPGLVCRALEIDRTLNGVDLTTGEGLFLEEGDPVPDTAVRVGPRIGVAYSGAWAEMPWRFWTATSSPREQRRERVAE